MPLVGIDADADAVVVGARERHVAHLRRRGHVAGDRPRRRRCRRRTAPAAASPEWRSDQALAATTSATNTRARPLQVTPPTYIAVAAKSTGLDTGWKRRGPSRCIESAMNDLTAQHRRTHRDPRRRRLGPGPPGLEPRRRPAPDRRGVRRERRRRRAVLRFCADHDLRVLGQGTGHGAVAVGAARRHGRDQDRAPARDRDRRRGGDRAGRGRRARAGARRGGGRARPVLDAGLLAGRRHHGLHARRRPQLAGAPLRLRLQPGRGDRGRDRRRRGRAPSTRTTSPTCSGPCAAGAAGTRSSPRCTST